MRGRANGLQLWWSRARVQNIEVTANQAVEAPVVAEAIPELRREYWNLVRRDVVASLLSATQKDRERYCR